MSECYEFVGGPEDKRWHPVPDNVPNTILFPYQVPFNELAINPAFFPVDLRDIRAVYRKAHGYYVDETGVEKTLRYEFQGFE